MGAADSPFIAGIKPDQRPANAPVITEAIKDQAWYAKALTGISQPYPDSLRFLDDQGSWYTPFNRPGMTGRYDIRGWHTQKSDQFLIATARMGLNGIDCRKTVRIWRG